MWYFIMIMCVVMMFLFCLALYRIDIFSKQEKKLKNKIHNWAENFTKLSQEKFELDKFKCTVENLVLGKRSDKEVRTILKKLLSRQR